MFNWDLLGTALCLLRETNDAIGHQKLAFGLMILAIAGLFYGFISFFLSHVIVPRYPFYAVIFHRPQTHTHMSFPIILGTRSSREYQE